MQSGDIIQITLMYLFIIIIIFLSLSSKRALCLKKKKNMEQMFSQGVSPKSRNDNRIK